MIAAQVAEMAPSTVRPDSSGSQDDTRHRSRAEGCTTAEAARFGQGLAVRRANYDPEDEYEYKEQHVTYWVETTTAEGEGIATQRTHDGQLLPPRGFLPPPPPRPSESYAPQILPPTPAESLKLYTPSSSSQGYSSDLLRHHRERVERTMDGFEAELDRTW